MRLLPQSSIEHEQAVSCQRYREYWAPAGQTLSEGSCFSLLSSSLGELYSSRKSAGLQYANLNLLRG